jgi:hypothetical protein
LEKKSMKSMYQGFRMVLTMGVLAASTFAGGCVADDEEHVGDAISSETPYYTCWNDTTWSTTTNSDTYTEWKSRTGSYSAGIYRQARASLRTGHPYSVRVDTYVEGNTNHSGWTLQTWCNNGTSNQAGSTCTGSASTEPAAPNTGEGTGVFQPTACCGNGTTTFAKVTSAKISVQARVC